MQRQQTAFITPAANFPTVDASGGDACDVGPISQRQGRSACGQINRIAFISSLFGPRAPFQIARLVVPFVIDSLKRVTGGWPSPYGAQERREIIETKFDPTPPIVFIRLICQRLASIFSVGESTELGSDSAAFGLTVLQIQGRRLLCIQAPARLRVLSAQMQAGDANDLAALAFAKPSRALFGSRKTQNSEAAKSLPGQVLEGPSASTGWRWKKLDSILIVAHSVYSLIVNAWVRFGVNVSVFRRTVCILPQPQETF